MPQTKEAFLYCKPCWHKNIIVAVNKMDLINFDKDIFEKITKIHKENVAKELDFHEVNFIPVSALWRRQYNKKISPKMAWYSGKPKMSMLETIKLK